MNKVVYVCTGRCGAVISEKQFKGGLTVCDTEGCPQMGHPFEKRLKCSVCSQTHKEEEPHTH